MSDAPVWGRMDAEFWAVTATSMFANHRRNARLNIRFDENDDLVLDDIPDDLIAQVSNLAADRAISEEDMWRKLIMELFAKPPQTGNM